MDKGKINHLNNLVKNLSSNKILSIILLCVSAIILNKLVSTILNKLSEKYTSKRILIKNLIPISKFIINAATIYIIIFHVFALSKESLLAFGVSAGVAIGFAIQDLLANIFGGFVIILTRPFNIGDKIKINDYYGEVIDINLLKVRIVTPDDSQINVPSKTFLVNSISNTNSGALDCQVVTDIILPGDIDTTLIRQIAHEAAMTSPYLYTDKPIVILFNDYFDRISLIRLRIKAYVFDHRYEFKFSSDIYERIKIKMREKNLVSPQFYYINGINV